MDRCAILVDAGYLLGAAGTLVARDPDRSALEVDHAKLADALIHEAEVQTGLPVLRLLWYDGAFNSRPGPEHRTLRVLADVKVRLGELVVRAGRLQRTPATEGCTWPRRPLWVYGAGELPHLPSGIVRFRTNRIPQDRRRGPQGARRGCWYPRIFSERGCWTPCPLHERRRRPFTIEYETQLLDEYDALPAGSQGGVPRTTRSVAALRGSAHPPRGAVPPR